MFKQRTPLEREMAKYTYNPVRDGIIYGLIYGFLFVLGITGIIFIIWGEML